MDVDCFGIIVHGMQQLGSGHLGQFANSMFGHAGLVVCSGSTEGHMLFLVFNVVKKFATVENAIVCVVALDSLAV